VILHQDKNTHLGKCISWAIPRTRLTWKTNFWRQMSLV